MKLKGFTMHIQTFLVVIGFVILATVPIHECSAADTLDPSLAVRDTSGTILWYDIRLLDVEGRGWNATADFYDRLPSKAANIVRKPVWSLSRDSAGMCARFTTDAADIHARWSLRSESLAMPHMPATGVSGLDLYVKTISGEWRWLANGRPTGYPTNTVSLVQGLPDGRRDYILYLPLYNGVTSVEIGIPEGAPLSKAGPWGSGERKQVVFYGTSITQGGCVSRPGMVHTAIIGRRLNYPVINLGDGSEGAVDGSHPNDLGFMRQAEAFLRVLAPILEKGSAR